MIKNYAITLLIGIIVGFLLCYKSCKTATCPDLTKSVHDTIRKFDTSQHTIPPPIAATPQNPLKPDAILQPYPVEVPAIIDTQAIVKQFYQPAVYTRNFNNDSLKASITDTTEFNRIVGSSGLKYKWLLPTQFIKNDTNIYVNEEHRKLFIGIQTNFNSKNLYSLTPTLEYESLSGIKILAGYNLLQPPNIVIGAAFKIHIGK